MYDVIVIGARCAGAPAAMLLGRKGYKVLLVDRATFPSDVPHGHFIHRHGPGRLARWGLLDRIAATGCPPVVTSTMDLGDFPLVGTNLVADGVALGYGPRRSVFDMAMIDAASEANVEIRTGYAVEGFTTDRDRITGIRGRARSGGAPNAESATIVVGADGRHSRLARLVGAAKYNVVPPLTCWYFSYWSGAGDSGIEMYFRPGTAVFAFPTNDSLIGVFAGWPMERFSEVRADIEGHFMAAVDGIPALSGRLRAGRREEPFKGAADLPNFFRKPYGPGWALVGDAGCHKDPMLALGMCDALRDADLLVEALDDGLSGGRPLDDALADYQRRRDEASADDFRDNLDAARFKPARDEVLRIRAAIRDKPEETRQFFMARQGMIPRETFFNPENLERLLGNTGDQESRRSGVFDLSMKPRDLLISC